MALGHDGALRALVERAADELVDADASDILKWADDALDGRLVVATSMQDAVVVDLASQVRPGIDVIFLDTGYHFAETIGMRDAVKQQYPIRLLNVTPGQSVEEQDEQHGKNLYERNPDLCCYLRKVVPLNTMLGMYDGWVTGLRRVESPSRANAQPIEWDERHEMVKVNPIVAWTDEQVDAYVADRGILLNPLLSDGYGSVGCGPCTRRIDAGADPRSGRWAGTGKLECGIHN